MRRYLLPPFDVGVIGNNGWIVQDHPDVCEIIPSESVTVGHSECAWVKHHLLVEVEVENVVELVIVWGRQWDSLPVNKCSWHNEKRTQVSSRCLLAIVSQSGLLSVLATVIKPTASFIHKIFITHTLMDATVLALWFHHLYGTIFQVEMDLKHPDSLLLNSWLRYIFLEECIKTQNLERQRAICHTEIQCFLKWQISSLHTKLNTKLKMLMVFEKKKILHNWPTSSNFCFKQNYSKGSLTWNIWCLAVWYSTTSQHWNCSCQWITCKHKQWENFNKKYYWMSDDHNILLFRLENRLGLSGTILKGQGILGANR